MRFKVWRVFQMRMRRRPVDVVVALLIQDHGLVGSQRVPVSRDGALFQDILTAIVHGGRRSGRVR